MSEILSSDTNSGQQKQYIPESPESHSFKRHSTKIKVQECFFEELTGKTLFWTQAKIISPIYFLLGIILLVIIHSSWESRVNLSKKKLSSISSMITTHLHDVSNSINSLSHNTLITPYNEKKLNETLTSLGSKDEFIKRTFYLTNDKYQNLTAIEKTALGNVSYVNENQERLFTSLTEKYKHLPPYINERLIVTKSTFNAEKSIDLIKPVVNYNGMLLGFLGVEISVSELVRLAVMKNNLFEVNPNVYLYSDSDRPLVAYSFQFDAELKELQPYELQNDASAVISSESITSSPWIVILTEDKASLYREVIDDVFIYVLFVLLFLFAFTWAIKKITSDHYKNLILIENAIRNLTKGDLNPNKKLNSNSNVELKNIYKAINILRDRNIHIASLCEEIMVGDTEQYLPLLCKTDHLGQSFNGMVKQNNVNQLTLKNSILYEESRARTDSLTGVGNRLMFKEGVERIIKSNKRFKKREVAAVLLDLNKFKPINDNYGHKAGDVTLITVARRIRSTLRHDTYLARIGGDEFAILVSLNEPKELSFILDRILKVFKSPVLYEGFNIDVSCSIGVAFLSKEDDSTTLLHKADLAMYKSKNNNLDFSLFDAHLDAEIKRSREVIKLLPEALKNGEISSAFQCINNIEVNLDKSKKIIMVEALLRWNTDNNHIKNMNIGEVITLIERSEIIDLLTRETISQCAKLKSCLDSGIEVIYSINISPYQFRRDGFLDSLCLWVSSNNLKNENFILEITERFNSEIYEAVLNRVSSIKQLGFGLSLDDLGAGNTSLNQVLNFKANYIKIDMLLLRNAKEDAEGLKVFNNICKFSLDTGAMVIAEGIEDEDDLDIVINAKCTHWQGYHSSKPLLIEEFVEFYNERCEDAELQRKAK